MRVEKDAVVVVANFGKSGGEEQGGAADGCEAKDHIPVSDTFCKQIFLYKEVQIQASMTGEKDYDDTAEESMVRIQFFVGHPR